ncbi:hypothetical protein FJR38_13905 [Anabaena sp. UHCC 0253]|nr:hypothetical protein [Anabaena sp. UHCC 0253]MTJ53661.1 hypothetical protein [Anabaena sp. UHCC 0253]
MKGIVFGILLPFALTFIPIRLLAQELQPPTDLSQNPDLQSTEDSFYTTTARLIQQQKRLIARMEEAFNSPDANKMISVRGQLITQTIQIEGFLKRQYPNSQKLCNSQGNFSDFSSLPIQFNESRAQIYCSLFASSQELFKLRPIIDRLLSRRGEITLVRELPLVSGERQLDPVLPIAPVVRPNLNKPAIPLDNREPNLTTPPLAIIGRTQKTAIANYVPPMQPAIAVPIEALNHLQTATQFLQTAPGAFPSQQQAFTALNRLNDRTNSPEQKIYANFLELPNTGMVKVLPNSAYHRQPNTVQNRLEANINGYPFSLGIETKGSFVPSLPLQVVGENFQLVPENIDYGFIVDVGDLALEKLDGKLAVLNQSTRDFFLNYQPPKELESLQIDKRRFVTGKNQNWNQPQVILTGAKAQLNRTYLVRSLQFQLPDIILNNQPITRRNSRAKQQLSQVPSSDIIIAFRPVRSHLDGSYTILWRVLNQLPAPQIEDLEKYVQ